MSVQDPEDGAVKLDHAEARGLMGYPPITGRVVTVRLLNPGETYRVGDVSVTPFSAWEGTVSAIGPLGFLLVDIVPIVQDGDGIGSAGTVLAGQTMFFPWSAVVVWWNPPGVKP